MTTHKAYQNVHISCCLFYCSISENSRLWIHNWLLALCANPYNPHIFRMPCANVPCVMSNYKFQALIIDLPLLMDEWDCSVWRYVESLTFVASLLTVNGGNLLQGRHYDISAHTHARFTVQLYGSSSSVSWLFTTALKCAGIYAKLRIHAMNT